MPGRVPLRRLAVPVAALALLGGAPLGRAQSEMADLREDVRGLSQRVNELSLRIEDLERENADLKARTASLSANRDTVTAAQLNAAVADLNASIQAAVAASKSEVLQQVAAQMEKMARQTNAALDSIARSVPPPPVRSAPAGEPAKAPAFGDAYPKEGISYTVAKGDSIGVIARKTGAKVQDIIDANKILDPARIQVGQVLFIPGGK